MTKKKSDNVEKTTFEVVKGAENAQVNETTNNVADSSFAGKPSEASVTETRKSLVDDFNKKFSDFAEIEDIKDTKTQEEKEKFQKECQEDFENLIKDFNAETFEIAEKDTALETAKFLKEWNEKCAHWENESWKGVILFDQVISEIIEKIEKGDKDNLTIDYAALIFLYGTMNRASGIGLESAKLMEVLETDTRSEEAQKEDKVPAVTYSNILKNISKHIERIKLIDAKMNIYQQRWSMAANDFNLKFKITDLEEFGKFAEALKVTQ